MAKEANNSNITPPKQPNQTIVPQINNPSNQVIINRKSKEYRSADKFNWQDFKNSIPPAFFPSKFIGFAFLALLLIVAVIGAMEFPLSSLFSGKLEGVRFAIGIPIEFFVLNLENPEEIPFKISGILIDCAIYLLIAYALNILFNVLAESRLIRNKNINQYNLPKKKPNIDLSVN